MEHNTDTSSHYQRAKSNREMIGEHPSPPDMDDSSIGRYLKEHQKKFVQRHHEQHKYYARELIAKVF